MISYKNYIYRGMGLAGGLLREVKNHLRPSHFENE